MFLQASVIGAIVGVVFTLMILDKATAFKRRYLARRIVHADLTPEQQAHQIIECAWADSEEWKL